MVNKNSFTDDLVRAFNHSISCTKIAVMALGTIVALFLFALFGGLGGLIEPKGLQWLAWIIQKLGLFSAFIIVVSTMTAVVKMAMLEEKGEKKLSFLGAIGATIGNIPKVLAAVINPILLILAAVLVIWLFGLIGWIPAVGPVIWGIIGILVVCAGIYVAYTIFKLFLGVFALPNIISEGKQEGKSYRRTMSDFVKGHLFSLLGRLAIVALVIAVFLKIAIAGVGFAERTTRITMIDNYSTMTASPIRKYIPGFGAVRFQSPILSTILNTGAAFRKAGTGGYEVAGTEEKIGGWIYHIELVVVASVILAIAGIFFATSGCYAYQSLKEQPPIELKMPEMNVDVVMKKAEEIKSKVQEKMREPFTETSEPPSKE